MPTDPVPGLLARAAEVLEEEFGSLPEFSPAADLGADLDAMARVLEATAHRLGNNYPYFHPLYAGQMLKPPHPVARAAYALAMTINPNNHALDGGRASSEMEIEAVAEIAGMFGWTEFLGHLTSSGTIANLEALWISGQVAPGRRIVGSEQAHYTHQRISAVLKLEYGSIAADERGRMSLEALENELRKGDVGTVVVTLGTTAIGAVDPLDEILSLRDRYGFRVHVDAAYGGYFKLIAGALDEPARNAYAVIDRADSIVVDPHKHGLQPYGCGCVLFRDPGVGRFYKHDSPYTYFTSKALHLGEISLECSRAGAAAVALWATQKLLPLKPGGELARGLAKGRSAALEMDRRLRADERFQPLRAGTPELDIVVWGMDGASPERCSWLAQKEFDACATRNLHLALVQLPRSWFGDGVASGGDAECLTCLRSVLMKPEHEAWLDRIWEKIDAASTEILKEGKAMTKAELAVEGKENVLMRTRSCSITVLPHLGGKIASLQYKGRELLQAPLAPLAPRTPSMSFDAADASGWDECLPSVAPCTVETSAGAARIPDHGDLWRVAWEPVGQNIPGGASLALRGKCFSLPLALERNLTLNESEDGAHLRVDYTVRNTGDHAVPWSWAAHPLFAIEAGDQILLPASITSMRLEGSGRNRLGTAGNTVNWPVAMLADGSRANLSIAEPAETGIGDKLFAGPLAAGENWCILLRSKTGLRIKMSFDAAATPYLGLWICYGGWPGGTGPKQMCVAPEPSTAPVDSLAETGNWSRKLAPGASFSWPMYLDFGMI